MSKILEKNLISERANHYWKQFAGWVIDLRSKYQSDIFFRTELNVIGLQIIFAIILSFLLVISLNYFYKDILQTIISSITENIKNHKSFTSNDIVNSIELVKAKNFFTFFGVGLSVILAFSYIIARLTLIPTRQALTSQKRFISDIAHELRTPLSVIKTNCEVALLDESFDSHSKKMIKTNIEELDRVSTIINNLLTFSNLVHPEQIKFTLVNLSDVIDSSIKKLDELIRKKEIKVFIKKTSPSSIRGNTIALEQIVINIVKNAINYNHERGTVTVKVEPDYVGNIVLSIEDTGIGIGQKDLTHIFEPFFRSEKSRNRSSGSSGLGLTIVSELVKLHSGRISVRSKLNEGTVVTILFPYFKPENAAIEIKQTRTEMPPVYLKKKV